MLRRADHPEVASLVVKLALGVFEGKDLPENYCFVVRAGDKLSARMEQNLDELEFVLFEDADHLVLEGDVGLGARSLAGAFLGPVRE